MRLPVFIVMLATAVPVPHLHAAVAATASATMTVSAVVEPSCNLNVAPLTFQGATGDSPQVDAEASISLGCTPDTSFSVSIDNGRNTANGRRRMVSASGNGFLAYDIYQDAGRTRLWGGTAAGAVSGVVPGSGQVQLNAYGRITSTGAAADRYADTVTVLIVF